MPRPPGAPAPAGAPPPRPPGPTAPPPMPPTQTTPAPGPREDPLTVVYPDGAMRLLGISFGLPPQSLAPAIPFGSRTAGRL